MRELPRDLVTILRTEAKNCRNPPVDYVIAEDGGRMVHHPEPDIAMAELLEEAATALAANDAELAAVKENCETVCNSYADENQRLYDRAERAEAQLAEARKALNAGEALSRQLHAVIDRLNGQAYSSTLSALNYFDAARRAREGGKVDG